METEGVIKHRKTLVYKNIIQINLECPKECIIHKSTSEKTYLITLEDIKLSHLCIIPLTLPHNQSLYHYYRRYCLSGVLQITEFVFFTKRKKYIFGFYT